MRWVIISCLLVSLCGGAVVSQSDAPATVDSTRMADSLLEAGFEKLLSYLFLTPDDFIFRNDYAPKDRFRLEIVDSLMAHPLKMAPFADSCAAIFAGFEKYPDSLMSFFEGARGRGPEPTFQRGLWTGEGPFSLHGLPKRIRPQVQIIADRLDTCQTMIKNVMGGWDTELSHFIVEKYPQLLLEDENYKEQSAEQMDSVQHLEEGYAREFVLLAADLPDIFFLEISGILGAVDSIAGLLHDEKTGEAFSIGKKTELKTPYGRVVIGTSGDDVYRGGYFMIIDPAGNDTYRLIYDLNRPHSILIADYGGDDFYSAESDFAMACGAFSYSLLLDYAGDDIYQGGNFSLGAGYFGLGLLWDKSGNDLYFGDTFTEGAGTFGLGLLIDEEGSDGYTGNLFCQGFGFVRGFGGIIDHLGNDVYNVQGKYPESFHAGTHFQSLSQGFAIGFRQFLSGGVGFIYDFDGQDSYIADFFCQAASYWWSLGMIYDRGGDDRYLSHQYAQGSGTHMALGYLYDAKGDDIYRSHGVCQGCGHDYSCGWLVDLTGNDIYSAYDLAQGAGQANGFGLFFDGLGDDGYFVFRKDNTQGYGNPRRDYGSIGLFLDAGGADRYDGNGAEGRFWRTDSRWGGGLDLDRTVKKDQPVTGKASK